MLKINLFILIIGIASINPNEASASSSNASSCASVRDIVYEKHLKKVKPYKQCVINAALNYKIPEWALLAVIRQEDGPLDGFIENANGTKDYGLTCINDLRFEDLRAAGFDHVTPELIMSNPCAAIVTTAYFLKKDWITEKTRIGQEPDWLTVIGNYHYHYKGKNPIHHERYKTKITERLEAFAHSSKACYN